LKFTDFQLSVEENRVKNYFWSFENDQNEIFSAKISIQTRQSQES